MTEFRLLRWVLVILLISLLWATMGSAAPMAECRDFGHCALAPEGGGHLFRGDNGYRAGDSIGTSGGDMIEIKGRGLNYKQRLDRSWLDVNAS